MNKAIRASGDGSTQGLRRGVDARWVEGEAMGNFWLKFGSICSRSMMAIQEWTSVQVMIADVGSSRAESQHLWASQLWASQLREN